MKRNYSELIENTIRKLELPVSKFWLTEGVAEIAKQFPKLPEETIREIIAYDPTYKGGDELGKYGKWIISLYYNYLKNRERWKQYNNFMKANPDGVNPKTGQKIVEPTYLPEVKPEDTYKIKPLLKQYEMLKGKIKKPITAFKTVPDLYAEIEKFNNQGVPQDKKALERYYVFKDCEEKGLKKIYEDKSWLIGIPETFESSKPFGNFTNWCTTSSNGTYYDRYLKEYGGQYYILLNKDTGELFQFHFESDQFMDERDNPIDMYNFTEKYRNIAIFLNDYKHEVSNPEDMENDRIKNIYNQFIEYIKSPEDIVKNILYMNYTKVKEITDNKIRGHFDLDSLNRIVYSRDNSRDGLSLNSVCKLLTEFYDCYYDNYGLRDYSYQGDEWDSFAKKYGIEEYNWEKICNIYFGQDEAPEEITNIIQEDFYDGQGLSSFLNQCSEYGTQAECEDDIFKDLMDNLPISDKVVTSGVKDSVEVNFEITMDDLWQIHYIQCTRNSNASLPRLDDINNIINKKEPKQLSLIKDKMREDWFQDWKKTDDDDTYYDYEDEDWLYLWRVIHGKCDMTDGVYGAFEIIEPSYGWSGFDDKYCEDGFEHAAQRIAKIVNKTSDKEEKVDTEVDKQISEVLRIAR